MSAVSSPDLDTSIQDSHNCYMNNWATELRKRKPTPMRSFAAPNDIWLSAADQAAANHISLSHVLREALKAYAATGKLATEK